MIKGEYDQSQLALVLWNIKDQSPSGIWNITKNSVSWPINFMKISLKSICKFWSYFPNNHRNKC